MANSQEALERLQIKYGIDRGPDAQVIYNGCIREFPTEGEEQADPGKRPIRLVLALACSAQKKQKRLLQSAASWLGTSTGIGHGGWIRTECLYPISKPIGNR